MSYGWPQVIPLEQGLYPSSQQIIYLKVINRLFLVVSPSHIELWSSFQVPLFFVYSCGNVCGFVCIWVFANWVFLGVGFFDVGMLCFVGFQLFLWFFWLVLGFGFLAQSEIGEVQEEFGFAATGGREFAGCVESWWQINSRSCKCFIVFICVLFGLLY